MTETCLPRDAGRNDLPSRRDFVTTLGTAALAASVSVSRIGGRPALGESGAGTAIARFYRSLQGEWRKLLCFPFDHPNRSRVQNNWAIARPTIADLSPEQRSLCREIFKDLCSEEGYERFRKQMADDSGGFERYHVAVFGEPGTEHPFEWVLTGRHVTLRADGHSGAVARGGPIFLGHSAGSHHHDNVWSYQGRRAIALFSTLDADQRARALVDPSAPLATGIPVAALDSHQKLMVQHLLRDLMLPFRALEFDGVRDFLREPDGPELFRLTFFKSHEGGDRVGDVWKLEGPSFTWSYHGAPHVHSWVNFA